MAILLRPFDPGSDILPAMRVWQQSLGAVWPISEVAFEDRAGHGIVADSAGIVVGVALVDRAVPCAGLKLIAVAPEYQRRGLGTALHEAALEMLVTESADQVHLGRARDYFWPGVPGNLPAAIAFFERLGWELDDICWDLVQDVRSYRTPAGTFERVEAIEAVIRIARDDERPAIVEIEERHFPQWAPFFRTEDTESMVVAIDRDGMIAGALLIERPGSRPVLWAPLLGTDAGAIGAVGVIPALEGRGIGTAMVAYAGELLRDAGTGSCHVGWTYRVSFYGRLGFQPWRSYAMSRARTVRS